MSKYYKNSTELLKSIKRRAVVPASQNLFDDQDFLDFATEEIDSHVVAMVNKQQQNHFLVSVDIPLVQGQTKYEIHYRASGNKLKDLSFIPANSTEPEEMNEIDLGEVPDYANSTNSSQPFAYYTASNEICLVPESNNYTGSLRFSFYLRTNSLVPMDEVGVITAIDTTTGMVTVNEIPEGFLVTDLYDFIMERSPHKIISFDLAVSSVDMGTSQITFNPADLPSTLRVGDHICRATETAIPNVPSDLHNLIAHRAAARALAAVGDTEAVQIAEVKSAQLDASAETLISKRVETSAKKITNRHGFLRGRGPSRRGSY